MNQEQVEVSKSVLSPDTVDMLLRVHQDAKWILENLGVGCKQPEIQAAFKPFEAEGAAVIYEDRIYVTSDLVERWAQTYPLSQIGRTRRKIRGRDWAVSRR